MWDHVKSLRLPDSKHGTGSTSPNFPTSFPVPPFISQTLDDRTCDWDSKWNSTRSTRVPTGGGMKSWYPTVWLQVGHLSSALRVPYVHSEGPGRWTLPPFSHTTPRLRSVPWIAPIPLIFLASPPLPTLLLTSPKNLLSLLALWGLESERDVFSWVWLRPIVTTYGGTEGTEKNQCPGEGPPTP